MAANALSERFQQRNMRRMKVNAQVTAIVTFLESIGNLIRVLIALFVTRIHRRTIQNSTYVLDITNLLGFLILYFILLPYAFLMNTKHNKNRVVEDGWQGIFKNIFWIRRTGVPKSGKAIENLDQNNDIRASTPLDKVK